VKTLEGFRSPRDINDDPEESLEPEGNPGDDDIEEGDEETDEEDVDETGLPPAMPPAV